MSTMLIRNKNVKRTPWEKRGFITKEFVQSYTKVHLEKLIYRSKTMSPNQDSYEKVFDQELLMKKNNSLIPERKYRWHMIIMYIVLHTQAIYGLYLIFTSAKILTIIFGLLLHFLAGFATTAGVHRLWSHRSYKATWQLRLLFMIFQTLAFQDSIYRWCRYHRLHHKYTDTNADPHSALRGLFFSHIGWLLIEPHPECIEKRKALDFTDLKRDPLVRFQARYYMPLLSIICFILPTILPWYFWNENLSNGWFICACFRSIMTLNLTALINSWAHFWGYRPYDKDQSARESLGASIICLGEGWHNYHHVFPWDYRASELCGGRVNPTSYLIQLFAKIGWAYDLKTVSDDVIRKRIQLTGDGSHSPTIWGWGDDDQTYYNKSFATIEK